MARLLRPLILAGLCWAALPALAADERLTGEAYPYADAALAAAVGPGSANVTAEATSPAVNPLDEGYRLLREKNDAEALAAFRLGLDGKPDSPVGPLADAGYTAWRLGENALATDYFRRSVDGWYRQPDNAKSFGENTLFDIRRKVQEMERRWGLIASLAYRGGCFGNDCAKDGPPYDGFTQLGLEAYWQPAGIGYREGRILQFYVRGFTTLDDTHPDAPHGGGTGKYFAGVRYKPLADYNLVLSAEQAIYKGSITSSREKFATSLGQPVNGDSWLRIGFSADEGVDLKPTAEHWPTWQFFTEGGYSLDENQYIQSVEARWGHSWKGISMNPGFVVTPHLVLGGDYNSDEPLERTAIGAGPGVSLRQWFREGRYTAPASWLDLTMQYRFAVNGAKRAAGPYLRVTVSF